MKLTLRAASSTLLAVAGLALAATPAAAQAIKVGIVGPFSGPFAHYGTLFKAAAEAYVATQGGKLAGKDIEFIYRDTGGPNPGQTKTLVQELIVKDKVDYLGGFVFTPNALAVAPLIQQSHPPLSSTPPPRPSPTNRNTSCAPATRCGKSPSPWRNGQPSRI